MSGSSVNLSVTIQSIIFNLSPSRLSPTGLRPAIIVLQKSFMILSLAVVDSARSRCNISFYSSSGRAGMNEQAGPTSFTLSQDNPVTTRAFIISLPSPPLGTSPVAVLGLVLPDAR